MDEKNELQNRAMHISGKFTEKEKVDIATPKVDIERTKKIKEWNCERDSPWEEILLVFRKWLGKEPDKILNKAAALSII